ncbi:Phospholipase D1 [Taxawa tesnikishii (nom. ined.)]|nr:Phospholipase D1 [Dothideales sp. JES 119]
MEELQVRGPDDSPNRSPRSVSPMTISAKGKEVAKEPNGRPIASPLRAVFSPEEVVLKDTNGAAVRPSASQPQSGRFGSRTMSGYFAEDAPVTVPMPQLPELPPELEEFDDAPGRPRPIPSRQGSDPLTARKRTNISGTATPPDRRSVQFARAPDDGPLAVPQTRTNTWDSDEGRKLSFPKQPVRVGLCNGTVFVSDDPGSEREEPRYPGSQNEESEIDGDVDESSGDEQQNDTETPEGRRPNNLRRFTGIATFDAPSSPFRVRADRHNSTSAQKWRQVKAGLKLLGQRKKDERVRVDHQKSAELMAELLAGSPAALFFASMYQRDENGRRKIPVLLEQLKIRITQSQTKESESGDRHMIFTIELEYGNGASRMTWTIHRTVGDFLNLHAKYKLQSQTDRFKLKGDQDRNRAKMPHFPRSAFPYLRGIRGLGDEGSEGEDEDIATEAGGHETEASGTDRPTNKKRRRSSFVFRRSSTANTQADGVAGDALRAGSIAGGNAKGRELYSDRQRKKLEVYLQQMIRWLIFRPDSNRLCKFLELSALAMRLSVEGGYHGKEGPLQIISGRNTDIQFRHLRRQPIPNPKSVVGRHKHQKWFLVRHSYVVCVDSPESLEPTEVFLVDSDFRTEKKRKRLRDQTPQEMAKTATQSATQSKHHVIRLYNAERKLKLLARNEKLFSQFKESIEHMQRNTIWSQKHRFDSFAPIRKGVFARWLVDGRDHMWQVSRAIDNARNFVYIHDWWLSPELYLRRPPAISQKWRLDRLLQRKAQEGVKIFVIVYRNIESAIPIDSQYTKESLLDLHPNIHIQRSPNQFRQNQFFWAHHEKLVVVDNAMAFVGGVDLCFGRWDDPSHSVTDDKLTGFELDVNVPRDGEHCQMWPGKDYSNPRVQDFYALDKPYEEMYDRTRVPRMPWHDIAMTIVGQPARDVGRHFVQRWNYILRQRTPSRPTPLLLPPPEYEPGELERLGLTGTCQIQILRSCTTWSIGTPNKTECSIMNAYVTLIQQSQHFVYIENQFFITSCTVEGTPIHNKIGDALVERIELAYSRGDKWRACIVIPLMPGFQNSVDAQDGTSIRLIMQCQYRSICRGEASIFGRLRAKGIDPQDYIEFYALRQWGKIGPLKSLTTEQLYIHAKCMVVDDRSAIIGSANINERSMLGSRDSEVAAIVTDQEMIPSYMGGEPFDVGTFPHTLRMRLMREHLGIDVDEIYRREHIAQYEESIDNEMEHIYREDFATPPSTPPAHGLTERNLTAEQERVRDASNEKQKSLKNWIDRTGTAGTDVQNYGVFDERIKQHKAEKHQLDVEGLGADNMARLEAVGDVGNRDTFVDARGREVLLASISDDHKHGHYKEDGLSRITSGETKVADYPWSTLPPSRMPRMSTRELGLTQLSQLPPLPALDDTDIGGPPLLRKMSGSSVVAQNNTKLYRQVFRCMPDNDVQSWAQYREYNAYNEKFMQMQGLGQSKPKPAEEAPQKSGPPGSGGTNPLAVAGVTGEKVTTDALKTKAKIGDLAGKLLRPRSNTSGNRSANSTNEEMAEKQRLEQDSRASNAQTAINPEDEFDEKKDAQRRADERATQEGTAPVRSRTIHYDDEEKKREKPHASETTATQTEKQSNGVPQHSASQKGRRRATTKSSAKPIFTDEVLEKDDAEELLKLTQGHLVLWPYDWLANEEKGSNWLYNIDQIAPLEI